MIIRGLPEEGEVVHEGWSVRSNLFLHALDHKRHHVQYCHLNISNNYYNISDGDIRILINNVFDGLPWFHIEKHLSKD